MKNIPVFTTASGVASLTLSNIPYNKTAYIQIQDSMDPESLLQECRDFCIAVGAESVMASGHPYLEKHPLYTKVLMLKQSKNKLPASNAVLVKVSEIDSARWREIYLERMQHVPNARYISNADMRAYVNQEQCFFVRLAEKEIGIGMLRDDEIVVIAGLLPGMGREILIALADRVNAVNVKVTVSDQNKPAIKLYERLGFQLENVVSKWYKIS